MAEPVRSLLERYHLTDEECSKQVSDRHLEELSRTHCFKWRRLPAYLNMDPYVEEDIDREASAEDEKRYRFFKAWKERNGSDATYKTLIAALLKMHYRGDAEYVCELLQIASDLSPKAISHFEATEKMFLKDQDSDLKKLILVTSPITPTKVEELEAAIAKILDAEPYTLRLESIEEGYIVLGETRVQVTNDAKAISWEKYGLKLFIPQQSLPKHIESCTITIKVSLSGLYQFPDSTELVSPVFWLSCEPQCSFANPLRLEIQHCALPENTDLLTMARADCTPADLLYTFKAIDGGVFSQHSSYGVIALSSFCLFSIIQRWSQHRRSRQRRYWTDIFYMPGYSSIHFAVTWYQNAYIKSVKDHYATKNALPGEVEQTFTFNEHKISLNIPREGIKVDHWEVRPAFTPIIEKELVDSHRPRNITVPHCVINTSWTQSDTQMRLLQHTIDILGTTEEKYFTIKIVPDHSGVQKESVDKSAPSSLNDANHSQIMGYLAGLGKDEVIQVGVQLGLKFITLKDATDLHNYMVTAWLRQDDHVHTCSGDPSWNSLCEALKACGHTGIAARIEREEMKK